MDTDSPIQLTLWPYPTRVERAAAVMAALREELREITRRGPRTGARGRKRSVDRVARMRDLDDRLAEHELRESFPGTEDKVLRVAMYEMAGLHLTDCDRDMGWKDQTSKALKHDNPELYRRCLNRLCDRAFGHFQKARVALVARMMTTCENATKVIEAAVAGDATISKDRRIASENALKIFKDLTARDTDWTPQEEHSDDEETEQAEVHATELGLTGTN